MAVTGYKFVLVGVLIGTEELRHARIDRDGDFISMMVDREEAFWRQVQEGDTPPPDGSEEATKFLRQLAKPVDGRVIELDSEADLDLDERFRTAAAESKRWDEELGLVKNLIQARMGDATLARLANGATWSRVNRGRKAYTANVAASTWVELKRS
jgi:predicted phage-related endonuclease